jgi:hypothetical protein
MTEETKSNTGEIQEEHYFTCDLCGTLHHNDEKTTTAGGDSICSRCYELNYGTCHDCEEIYPSHDLTQTHYGDRICDNCYSDGNYFTCANCQDVFADRDGHWDEEREETYCRECHGESATIHSAGHKPEPIFHGFGINQIGIELEVDKLNEKRNECARALQELGKQGDLFYLKEDGSLHDGIEIVSHPATLRFHLKQMPWDEILETVLSFGGRSHNTDTCGLHIHISKKAFGETRAQMELNQLKLLYFFERHWESLFTFSRRRHTNYCQRYETQDGLIYKPLEAIDAHRCKGRYMAVNLTNRATVEIRIFRGTLNKRTFRAALIFTSNLVEYLKATGISHLYRAPWNDLAEGIINIYPHADLIGYMQDKKLVETTREYVIENDLADRERFNSIADIQQVAREWREQDTATAREEAAPCA